MEGRWGEGVIFRRSRADTDLLLWTTNPGLQFLHLKTELMLLGSPRTVEGSDLALAEAVFCPHGLQASLIKSRAGSMERALDIIQGISDSWKGSHLVKVT